VLVAVYTYLEASKQIALGVILEGSLFGTPFSLNTWTNVELMTALLLLPCVIHITCLCNVAVHTYSETSKVLYDSSLRGRVCVPSRVMTRDITVYTMKTATLVP